MRELNSWASGFAEQRIQAGDYNAWPGASEISNMTSGHIDTWAYAKSAGTAVSYSGNDAGNTRNSRIDYVWLSQERDADDDHGFAGIRRAQLERRGAFRSPPGDDDVCSEIGWNSFQLSS